jgi:hypothetical protein
MTDKTVNIENPALPDRIKKLQRKIDYIFSALLQRLNDAKGTPAEPVIKACIEEFWPNLEDPFCQYCTYSHNGVLDWACNRIDCERFP